MGTAALRPVSQVVLPCRRHSTTLGPTFCDVEAVDFGCSPIISERLEAGTSPVPLHCWQRELSPVFPRRDRPDLPELWDSHARTIPRRWMSAATIPQLS